MELHRFGYDMQTEQNNWFRDIIWHCMSVTIYWRSSLVLLVILSLISWKTSGSSSLEQSASEISLWLDARPPDDERSWHQVSSGNDGVRTQHESRKRNADKEFKFFFFERADVTNHAYECLNDFLSLSILSERCWRYWRTYNSISFLNICWDIVDFWWVFRIQDRCFENLADEVHFCR